MYGVIFWQPESDEPLTQRNVTVFADGEVDRSPCGSGTSARLALLDAGGGLARGDELRHLSIVGSEFAGRVVAEADVAGRRAVVTEVEGTAYRTGRADVRARSRRSARRRLSPPLGEQRHDLVVLREAALALLREDERPVGDDVVLALVAREGECLVTRLASSTAARLAARRS